MMAEHIILILEYKVKSSAYHFIFYNLFYNVSNEEKKHCKLKPGLDS